MVRLWCFLPMAAAVVVVLSICGCGLVMVVRNKGMVKLEVEANVV